MPTTYNDQAYPVDAYNLSVPQFLTVGNIVLVDTNDDGLIDTNDTINGVGITNVFRGDTITVDGVTITGATIYASDGSRHFTPTDGSILSDGNATSSTWVFNSTNIPVGELGPVCFLRGTRLRGASGDIPVEELRVGELLVTADHGLQPVRWIGHALSPGFGRFAPVRIAAGALGNSRDLYVSQQHRMLVKGAMAELLFGEPELLVAAKHLVNGDTITCAPCAEADYFHVLLDRHEILFAEDCPSESFHPGDMALASNAALRKELFTLFPELETTGGQAPWRLSRPALRGREARVLTAAAPN